jgi:hypothetical protein
MPTTTKTKVDKASGRREKGREGVEKDIGVDLY